MPGLKFKYVYDRAYKDTKGRPHHVRCWRQDFKWIVQVWEGPEAVGDCKDEWILPGEFHFAEAVWQGVYLTSYTYNGK